MPTRVYHGPPAQSELRETTALPVGLPAEDRKLLGCYVRDDSKGHGLQKQLSGSSVSKRKVAITDSTCSSRHSLLKCAETVEQHGGEVTQVIALFDRDAGGDAVKAAG